ncbi:MAG: undecaprenyl-diphosphate phosphatase [Patescibacteria group bacterium]|nr:undecaprenyl-diphosphate phosphatase [Patescibacteria group bacterium]MDE1944317.1 undecaprenyl-diphosphate phosphatase [Patescibacteria group bacterium]MDE1945098.1 undecaprenyl-diphosphate phosphatase [Patescibacteria group bacterium]MDE2057608.1 undecaprenyl-diphosphate phosphatase [Patescibacteria group bacterium]
MTLFQSLILGLVEGATEFLPVSSTGHLILAASLLGVSVSDFTKVFEIAIQLGAIAAVVVLYFKTFFDWQLLFKLAAAFIPTGLIGLFVYPFFKSVLEGNEVVTLLALFFGGLLLIWFEKVLGRAEDAAPEVAPRDLSWTQAILVGFAQAVAIIPGVSRSGATIVGGLALGISRATIVEFSFLLAVPTMVAATGLSLYKDHAFAYTMHEWLALAVGTLAAFAVALAIVRWFLAYIRSHSFTAFGVYRVILSLVFLAWLFA